MSLYTKATSIWRFNGDGTDAKGNHNLINIGAPFDGTIKRYGSHSVIMDGINDYLVGTSHSDFNQSEFTLVYAVYIGTKGVWNTIVSKFNPSNDTGWVVGVNFLNQAFIQAGNGGGGWPAYSAVYDMSSSSLGWHLLMGSHSLTSHKLYWDDRLVASVAGGVIAPSSDNVWFGRNSAGSGFIPGQMDETDYFLHQITDGGVSVGQVAGGEYAELYANFLAGIELTSSLSLFSRGRMINLGGNLGGLTKSTLNNLGGV